MSPISRQLYDIVYVDTGNVLCQQVTHAITENPTIMFEEFPQSIVGGDSNIKSNFQYLLFMINETSLKKYKARQCLALIDILNTLVAVDTPRIGVELLQTKIGKQTGFFCLIKVIDHLINHQRSEIVSKMVTIFNCLATQDIANVLQGLSIVQQHGFYVGENSFLSLINTIREAIERKQSIELSRLVGILEYLSQSDAAVVLTGLLEGNLADKNGFYYLVIAIRYAVANSEMSASGTKLLGILACLIVVDNTNVLKKLSKREGSGERTGFHLLARAFSIAAEKRNEIHLSKISGILEALSKENVETVLFGMSSRQDDGFSYLQNALNQKYVILSAKYLLPLLLIWNEFPHHIPKTFKHALIHVQDELCNKLINLSKEKENMVNTQAAFNLLDKAVARNTLLEEIFNSGFLPWRKPCMQRIQLAKSDLANRKEEQAVCIESVSSAIFSLWHDKRGELRQRKIIKSKENDLQDTADNGVRHVQHP